MWSVRHTEEFARWFAQQDEACKLQVFRMVALLENEGPRLSRPYADTLNGSRFHNMKELRINAKRMAIRIAFAFDPRQDAILLVAGDKRGISETRFYRRLIAKADELYSEYLKG